MLAHAAGEPRRSRDAYRPDGINVGANIGRAAGAGVPGHVHVHVAAALGRRHELHDRRWPRPGCCPRACATSYDKLRAAWPAGSVGP